MSNEEQDGEFKWSVTSERAGTTPAFPLDPTLLGALLDHSTTQVGIFGRDHVYQYANQEMLDGLGRTWDQVVGQHLSAVLGPAWFDGIESVTQIGPGSCVELSKSLVPTGLESP